MANRPDKRTRAAHYHAKRFARKARIMREEALEKGHCRSAWDNMAVRGKGPRPNKAKDNRSASDVVVYS
jgi:hypothetical protein